MDKPKFTPGQWMLTTESNKVGYQIRANINGCFNQLAHVYLVDGVGEKRADQSRANAQLIAAAPEMYEALAKLEQLDFGHVGLQASMSVLKEAITLSRLALQKARGEG